MRCLDLFSGIGGFALACEWAGIETAAFCEIDPYCQAVLKKHWPKISCYPDIRTLKGGAYEGIDLICGGFPCQPYSVAGKRRGAADDRDLWPEMRRVIDEFRPRWVCAENTPGFVGMGLDGAISDLEENGYEVGVAILPALAKGAPHLRQRLFIIAHSHTNYEGLEGRNEGIMPKCPCEQPAGSLGPSLPNRATWDWRPKSSDSDWWKSEPGVGRVAHGVPNRVDRLRALGNAVVPQQVYPILKAIVDYERTAGSSIGGGDQT